VALGIPGLILWQRTEAKAGTPARSISEVI